VRLGASEIPETGVKPQKGRSGFPRGGVPLTGFTPLLGVDFQKVVVAHRELGEGNIYVSGTAFARQWNMLPVTGLLVVMAQRMAVGGASSEEQQALSLVAGERPRGIRTEGGEVEILSLVGDPIDWKGTEQEIPTFPRAGVYLARTGDNKYCVSVRASEKEGLEKFVEGSEVPAMGQIAHKILPYDEGEDFEQYHKGQAKAIGLYLLLLLLATLALLAEGLLGSHKSSRAGGAGLGHARRSAELAEVLQRAGQSTAEERISEAETVSGAPVNRLSRYVWNIIGKSTTDKTTRWRAG
jgi:hypothetical protein